MKKLIALSAGVLSAAAAFSQVPVTVAGDQVLIAGWDFQSLSATGAQSGLIVANFTDRYGSPQVDPTNPPYDLVGASTRGTFLFNGQGGSEDLPATQGILLQSGTQDAVKRAIGTKDRLAGGTQTGRNELGDRDTTGRGVGLSLLAGDTQTFSFKLNTVGVDFGQITTLFHLATTGGSTATIDWSYKIGAGPVVDAGIADTVVSGGYQAYTVDFSSIASLASQPEVYLVGAITNSVSAAQQTLRFDNLAIYGVIPEPSTYAAFAGLVVVGFAMLRRRRAA